MSDCTLRALVRICRGIAIRLDVTVLFYLFMHMMEIMATYTGASNNVKLEHYSIGKQ